MNKKDLQIQYLSDRRIATLNNEIAALYNIAIPKGIVRALDGSIVLIYEDKTNKEVKRIQSIINDIIKTEYLELIEYQDLHTSTKHNKK